MSKFRAGLKRFMREEDAPTMVEYGLVLVFVSLVVVVGANALGISLRTFLENSGTTVEGVGPPTPPTPGT